MVHVGSVWMVCKEFDGFVLCVCMYFFVFFVFMYFYGQVDMFKSVEKLSLKYCDKHCFNLLLLGSFICISIFAQYHSSADCTNIKQALSTSYFTLSRLIIINNFGSNTVGCGSLLYSLSMYQLMLFFFVNYVLPLLASQSHHFHVDHHSNWQQNLEIINQLIRHVHLDLVLPLYKLK